MYSYVLYGQCHRIGEAYIRDASLILTSALVLFSGSTLEIDNTKGNYMLDNFIR